VTALRVRDGIDDRPAFTAAEPLQRFFRQAGLAPPPASMRELRFDTDQGDRGQRKILLAFTVDRAGAIWFVASSPALRGVPSSPLSARSGPVLAVLGKERGRPSLDSAGSPEEPEFPWWRPGAPGSGRRWAFSTPDFDFVEVMISEHDGRIHIRAIN
jgi:hypothetical protein